MRADLRPSSPLHLLLTQTERLSPLQSFTALEPGGRAKNPVLFHVRTYKTLHQSLRELGAHSQSLSACQRTALNVFELRLVCLFDRLGEITQLSLLVAKWLLIKFFCRHWHCPLRLKPLKEIPLQTPRGVLQVSTPGGESNNPATNFLQSTLNQLTLTSTQDR